MLSKLKKELKLKENKERAEHSQGFFKTGKGEYGESDVFLGITIPELRKVAKDFEDLSFSDIQKLLLSKIHEERFVSLVILVSRYKAACKKSDEEEKEKIYNFYLKNSKNVNNWDLVDTSAHKIVGDFLLDKKRDILYKLVKSKNLWERRIAIISTAAFINNGELDDTFKISEILLKDEHDLIHKAVGWMLREAGKRDQNRLESFLKKYYKKIPRTTLRYAIEKFEESKRKKYLNAKI